MTAWDVLDKILNNFSPIVMVLLMMAVLVTFIVGFSRHGLNFLKYGFQQKEMGDLGIKLDEFRVEFREELKKQDEFRVEFREELETIKTNLKKQDEFRVEFKEELGTIKTNLKKQDEFRVEIKEELEIIKTNHFGHLKSFLCELTSILLDKNIINNTDKARLDNQLRDM
jgi:hypothetical protein